jgi:hypothetical protein
MVMKKLFLLIGFLASILAIDVSAQTKPKQVAKYDTIIVKHVDKPKPKPVKKTETKPIVKEEPVLPVPEFINQPYYYDSAKNVLFKLENTTAQLITKKKSLGLKGAKQSLSMDNSSSKVRFTSKKDIVFFIKTSGDVIDLTSYIKLYKFVNVDEKREVTIASKEGLLTDKDEEKGKLVDISVKTISKETYMIQFANTLEAGEYGFVWVKNMDLKEFNVFAFGIDWKTSN